MVASVRHSQTNTRLSQHSTVDSPDQLLVQLPQWKVYETTRPPLPRWYCTKLLARYACEWKVLFICLRHSVPSCLGLSTAGFVTEPPSPLCSVLTTPVFELVILKLELNVINRQHLNNLKVCLMAVTEMVCKSNLIVVDTSKCIITTAHTCLCTPVVLRGIVNALRIRVLTIVAATAVFPPRGSSLLRPAYTASPLIISTSLSNGR